MHFLCLHGKGTNSKIFKMQTSAIRYGLGTAHAYDFVEGVIQTEIDSDFKHLVDGDEEGFAYFDGSNALSVLEALAQLDSFIHDNGPYDGIIAFSQSVGLAGTWLLDRAMKDRSSVRCGIFFSGASTAVSPESLREGKLEEVQVEELLKLIDIPTAHIYGVNDPHGTKAKQFACLFQEDKRFILEHGGGHEIPGSGSDANVKESIQSVINIVRRVIVLGNQ